MQTVTPILPGAAASGARDSSDAASDGGVFPAAMRQALHPPGGKTSPPGAGKESPPSASTATAPADPGAAGADPAGDVVPQVDDANSVAAAAGVPVAEMAETPVTPTVVSALHDIVAGRSAANVSTASQLPVVQTAAVALPAASVELPVQAGGPAGRPDHPLRRLAGDDSQGAGLAQAAPVDHCLSTDASGQAPSLVPAPAPAAPVPVTVATRQRTDLDVVAAAAPQPARAGAMAGTVVNRPSGRLDTPTNGDDRSVALPLDAPAASDTPAPVVVTGTAPGEAAQKPSPSAGGSVPVFASAVASTPDFAPTGASRVNGTAADSGITAAAPANAEAPGERPDFNIAAPPGSPQFGPELGQRLLWLVRDGIHEARLQLNPRDLGPVEVRLSVGDGAAQVSFSAQHAGTAAAVQQSLPQLRDLLAEQGVQLGQASVFHQPGGDGTAAGRQQAQGSGAQAAWDGGQGLEINDGLPAPAARVIGRGLVDAYA